MRKAPACPVTPRNVRACTYSHVGVGMFSRAIRQAKLQAKTPERALGALPATDQSMRLTYSQNHCKSVQCSSSCSSSDFETPVTGSCLPSLTG